MRLVEYCPPAAQPGRWEKIVASEKSLLLFGPSSRVRAFCRWLSGPNPVTSSDPSPLRGEPENATGSSSGSSRNNSRSSSHAGVTAGPQTGATLPGGVRSLRTTANPPSAAAARCSVNNRGWWRGLLGGKGRHRRRWLARGAFQTAQICAVASILAVVSLDAEIASGRRAAADKTGTARLLEAAAVSAFVAEALVLAIARGLVLLPGSYLRGSSSDTLGFSLTVLSAVCLLWPIGGGGVAAGGAGDGEGGEGRLLSAVKALRALNVLRLARFAELSSSLMDLLRALRSSGRALFLAGAVVLFFWLQWSIVGLQVTFFFWF